MRRTERIITELANQQRDLVAQPQLLQNGIGYRTTKRLVERTLLEEVYPNVWRTGTGTLTFEQRMMACCLAVPSGVLSHGTAGSQYGLRKAPRDRLEVTVGYNDKVWVPDVLVHRSNRIDPEDLVYRLDGSRITSPERVVFDMAGVLDVPALGSLLHHAIQKELVSIESLVEVGGRLAKPGRRGTRQFVAALAKVGGQLPPVESDGELVLLRELEAAGLSPKHQHWVQLRSGAWVRMDIASPEVFLDIEYDPAFTHALPTRVHADNCRDIQVARVGFDTHRFTDVAVTEDLRSTVAAIVDLYRIAMRRRAA